HAHRTFRERGRSRSAEGPPPRSKAITAVADSHAPFSFPDRDAPVPRVDRRGRRGDPPAPRWRRGRPGTHGPGSRRPSAPFTTVRSPAERWAASHLAGSWSFGA